MTDTVDPRFGLTIWGSEASEWPAYDGWNTELQLLWSQAAVARSGLYSAIGSPSVRDSVYWATDTKRLWYSDGSTWQEVSPVGDGTLGQGPAAFTKAGGPGTAGASRVAARVDHTHPLPPWPVKVWDFPVTNTAVMLAGGFAWDYTTSWRVIIDASFTAPAGLYKIEAVALLSTQSASADASTTGYIAVLVNDTNVTSIGSGASYHDIPCGMGPAAQDHTVITAVAMANTATMNVKLQVNALQANAKYYAAGTHVMVTYLGPA